MGPELRDEQQEESSRQQLVRKGKLILYNRPANPILDESVVSVQRYNCFGSNLFPSSGSADLQFAAGVTSAGPGDGKTVVAANLATFFALDTQEDTILVDLNLVSPHIHDVFGVPSTPGILDSLRNDTITLSRTIIKGLWVLPLGEMRTGGINFERVLELREVITTLKQHFRFIIIDLPSVSDAAFPAMITSQLDGFIVVVSTGKTKKNDVSKVVTTLNENKIIGFVMNRVSEGSFNK